VAGITTLAALAADTEPALDLPEPESGAPVVLVIEDDPRDRAWLVRVLSGAGYAVETAANGEEARELCRRRTFDAITLDLLLPDTNGLHLLQALHAEGFPREVPVIVVTVVAEKLATGFPVQDVLTKPVEAWELLVALKRAGAVPGTSQPLLVVDRDPLALEAARQNLERSGYRVVCAADAETALRIVDEDPPAVVVLDLLFPGLDGFALLEHLRRTPAGRRAAVIVWNGEDLTEDDQRRLAALAQTVLVKTGGGPQALLDELRQLAPAPLSGNEEEEPFG
jgi:CheY-like chemotaxis protein